MRRISTIALAAALALGACGGEDGSDTTLSDEGATDTSVVDTTTSDTTMAETTTSDAPGGDTTMADTTMSDTTTAAAEATLTVAETSAGEALVDGEGYVLYLFTPDEQGASTCVEACASTWPPLIGSVTAGEGVDASLISTIEREDGSSQVTYDGWPLYYYAADAAPGDATGQGVNDVWYVVAPDGSAITGAVSGADDSGGGPDYDY